MKTATATLTSTATAHAVAGVMPSYQAATSHQTWFTKAAMDANKRPARSPGGVSP